MDIVIRTGFQSIIHNIIFHPQTLIKGKKLVMAEHIDETRLVTDVKCVCIYNQSKKCKHIAALIYFINNEESVSKTSHEQVWGKPSARQFAKNKYAKGKHFEEMFPSKRGKYYEAPGIDISKMIEESALKHVMVAKAANTNIYTVKRVMDSLLQQVEIDLEKEDSKIWWYKRIRRDDDSRPPTVNYFPQLALEELDGQWSLRT
ncbi:hypothetical protein PV325_012465 [Microctonus aethiopoides]|nr:hypothetical protein PV325_012465 [Microctonus aethiopoides]